MSPSLHDQENTGKVFGEKELIKQGSRTTLLRSKQIVNQSISDFCVRFFLTDEDTADIGA
jgi:hypothetical protein